MLRLVRALDRFNHGLFLLEGPTALNGWPVEQWFPPRRRGYVTLIHPGLMAEVRMTFLDCVVVACIGA